MRAVLTVNLTVRCTARFAEMAWMQRRSELGMLCREALAGGGRLDRETVDRVLPGVTDVGAENLVRACAVLGLCDRRGSLTPLAEDVARNDEAPVPEQGVFALWWVQHPLIGVRVLGARRLPADNGVRTQDLSPHSVPDLRGRIFASAIDPTERFVVRGLRGASEQGCELELSSAARCTLQWTLDFTKGTDAWRFLGQMEDPTKDGVSMAPMRSTPESTGADLGAVLVSLADGPLATLGRWNGRTQRLATPFDALAPRECEDFLVRREFSNVEVPGHGTFSRLELHDLPVEPSSKADAQRWSEGRLSRWFDAHPGYWPRAEVIRAYRSLVDETPLAPFVPTLPSHRAMLDEAAPSPVRYWCLAAPVDLALIEVPATQLAAVSTEPARVAPPLSMPLDLNGVP